MLSKTLYLAGLSILLAACGGGGGGGSGPGSGGEPPVATACGASAAPGGSGGVGAGGPVGAFQVSGTLNVEVSNKLEIECNNSLATAITMAPGDSFAGQAQKTDAGYAGITARDTVVIQDIYKLTVGSENVRVTLSFADNDLVQNDLDLFLLDGSGAIVAASSEGEDQSVETVTTTGAGEYYVGVRAFKGASPYLVVAGTTTATTALDRESVLPGAEFVPGEVFVRYKTKLAARAAAQQDASTTLADMGNDVHLVRVTKSSRAVAAGVVTSGKVNAPGHKANEAIGATIEALLKLKRNANVDFAEPNYIRHASAIPNDQYYKFQWHYPAVNLEAAWDNTIRGRNTIVAVIDTGIVKVVDAGVKKDHPDLAGQIVTGYDFISDAINAGDDNGVDSDPEDVGDGDRKGESSFHGTHVAGTIAAASDNAIGIAGVAWNAKIMPLRVLGKRGGTDRDIAQAIRYAAALTTDPPTPAHQKADIINLSLGGPNFSATVQTAINDARAANVIVVAAAGNENSNKPSYPAAYDNVTSVSAVGFDLKRAPYSNFGTTIDIAAPGGDTSIDRNRDGFADGVLSTLFDDTAGKPSYVFYQGTSMAAPHVAGVLALMRGINPALTPATIDQLIAGTHPTYKPRITSDLGEIGRDDLYGHGLIDAKKAIDAAEALLGPLGVVSSVLLTSADRLNFDSLTTILPINVTNGGDQAVDLNVTSVTATVPWISVSPSIGKAPLRMNVTIDRAHALLASDGTFDGTIDVFSDAKTGPTTKTIGVKVVVNRSATRGDAGTVFVLVIDPTKPSDSPDAVVNDTNLAEAQPAAKNAYRYAITGINPGFYYVYAGTDRDNDGIICEIEDACGTFGALVEVTAGAPLTTLNFTVNNSQNPPPPSEVIPTGGITLKRTGAIAK